MPKVTTLADLQSLDAPVGHSRFLVARHTAPSTSRQQHNTDDDDSATMSLVDPDWETFDPTPDIHALFIAYDARFFAARLQMVTVRWSPQMTRCVRNRSVIFTRNLCRLQMCGRVRV